MAPEKAAPSEPADKPADFDTYWKTIDTELERIPGRPRIEVVPARSTADYNGYELHLTSVGPYRIFGYFSVPTGKGPFPALFETPRHGSVVNPPHHIDRLRYVVLSLMHRGQRLADQPFAASYPGLFTLGIDSPASYVYRSILADCFRGAEFLLDRPEVDTSRVAIRGDDLALITAARRPSFTATVLSGQLFYRADEARALSIGYPLEELNDHVRENPDSAESMERTLALFDPVRHAPAVAGTTVLALGDDGGPAGLPWLQPLVDAFGGPVEQYRLSHRGSVDTEQLDIWLAGKLGTEGMSKFVRTLP